MSDIFGFESPFIGENSIFNLLTPDEMSVLKSNCTVTRFRKNDFIFMEGDAPVGMQYLKEGKVKMIKEGISGREQIIRMFADNGLISYRSLLAGEPHNGTAIAIEDSEIVTIPPDILYHVLLKNSNFSLALLKDLALELGHSNYRTVSLTQKHIRGRLAESILFLKGKYGFEDDNQTLKVYLSREDLASLSNMTASNAIRTLSTFAGEKIIAMDGRKIKITDLSKLEKVSKQG
ncbi:MAG: Crp/Fnr family transcriptional regulator [Bacteroidetes bacterium]|nr:Crp/Fnr family transcriptional regulator [Bacteroidota bacterium]